MKHLQPVGEQCRLRQQRHVGAGEFVGTEDTAMIPIGPIEVVVGQRQSEDVCKRAARSRDHSATRASVEIRRPQVS